MEDQFIPQAVMVVTQAIAADQAGDYEKALPLYKRSLEYFMTGLKYEKNPAARDTIKQVCILERHHLSLYEYLSYGYRFHSFYFVSCSESTAI